MTEHDRPAFCALIDQVAAAYGREATKALYQAHWSALRDLPLEAVERGVSTILRTHAGFMPSPADVRAHSGVMTVEERAEHAWETVVDSIRSPGGFTSVEFEDRAVTAAIRRMGGWVALTGKDSSELHTWSRKEFVRLYALLADGEFPVDEDPVLEGYGGGLRRIACGYLPEQAVQALEAGRPSSEAVHGLVDKLARSADPEEA